LRSEQYKLKPFWSDVQCIVKFVTPHFYEVTLISKVVAMFGLQRLAQDSNYAVARAASQAIDELKKQWELEEGDSLRFVMNQNLASEETDDGSSAADHIM
jgi:hypothetical protein